MKYLAIIQARCGSSRLPNKVLMDLAGKTLLERVFERAARSKNLDEIVVATSIGKENLPLIELCARRGFRVFVGSENDVLDRFYQAAKLFNPEYIVRITADCPFYDAEILDAAIASMHTATDYLADLDGTLADGLDIEIMKFSALETAWQDAILKSEREHVTLYIRNNEDKFNIQNFKSPIDNISKERWTIDEPLDYEFARRVYEHFTPLKKHFGAKEVSTFVNKNPKIKSNSHIVRNEGLQKSLQNDINVKGTKK